MASKIVIVALWPAEKDSRERFQWHKKRLQLLAKIPLGETNFYAGNSQIKYFSKATCRHWDRVMTTRIQGINKSEEKNFSGKADKLQAISTLRIFHDS